MGRETEESTEIEDWVEEGGMQEEEEEVKERERKENEWLGWIVVIGGSMGLRGRREVLLTLTAVNFVEYLLGTIIGFAPGEHDVIM